MAALPNARSLPFADVLGKLEGRANGSPPYRYGGADGELRSEVWTTCPVCKGPRLKIEATGDGDARFDCLDGCKRAAVIEALAVAAPEAVVAPTSWAPADIPAFLAGGIKAPVPTLLERSDGIKLLTAEKLTLLAAEPESCKSLLAAWTANEAIRAGELVAIWDFESELGTWAERLRALGLSDSEIAGGLAYIRPEEPRDERARAEFSAVLERGPALVIFDGLEEWFGLEGLDPNSNADTATLYAYARAAARSGAAVVMIDHVVKDKDARGRWARGAGHKIGGVDHAYALEVVEPFGRGRTGEVKVRITKDRGGHVQAHAGEGRLIGVMRLESDAESGHITIALEPPDGQHTAFRPTVLMARLWRAINEEPGITWSRLRDEVKGKKTDAKHEALHQLVTDGFVRREQDGQARRHYTVRPFIETAESSEPSPRPEPAPEPSRTGSSPTRPTVPRTRRVRGGGRVANGRPGEAEPAPAGCTCPTCPTPDPSGDGTCKLCQLPIRSARSSTCTCLNAAPSPRANGPAQCAICRRPVAEAVA